MNKRIRILCALAATLLLSTVQAQEQKTPLLIYCGITMVRPVTELAHNFEQKENVKISIAQGGSEDLYQSAKKSRLGDLYLPGEPSYRDKHLLEGLLGDYKVIGYNQMAIVVAKGNPKKVKGDPRELLRKDLTMMIGNAESGSVGQETKQILDALKLYPAVVQRATVLAPDSRAINVAMKRGEADIAFNWRATAFFPDNAPHIDAIDLDAKVAQPQALLLNLLTFSKNPALAKRFMDFVAADAGQAVFRKHGFLDSKQLR